MKNKAEVKQLATDRYRAKFSIPSQVQKVARMLLKEGYKCYLTGGAVRDIVRGEEPVDYDLATDATPEEMLKIFPKSVSTGARFGMVMAIVPDEHGENYEVEVTTFRSEEDYIDGRWPSKVTFVEEIDMDLGRRDFTWNAMAVDLSSNVLDGGEERKEWEIYDPFDGVQDIGLKVVRAVGTPIERFKEDGLRAIKACRMASQLQFDIEDATYRAITDAIPVVKLVSIERVRDEFTKLIMKSPKPSHGIELMRKTGLLELYIPELVECYGVEQKLYHGDDVYWHALRACDVATDNVKLAALFHDIGKPAKDTRDGHFYGHDIQGEQMTRKIMKRLRFSNKEIDRTARLVRNHMFFFPHYTEGMSKEEKQAMAHKEWSDAAIRRFIARVGEENLEDLFALRVADAASNPKTAFQPDEIEQLQARISEVRQKDMALKVTDLDISGNDLKEIGVEEGPEIGRILNELFELVLDDPLLNSKEKLLERARDFIA